MASSSSSLTSLLPRRFDVFLSFRGEDTRDNFTDHLYAALKRANILTFIDYHLQRGDEISPSLVKAIQDSKISVIIFSQNYASSRWCLEELGKILECKKLNGQIAIPVFYRVDPSNVRNQTGTYGDALAKHEYLIKGRMNEAHNLSCWASLIASVLALIGGFFFGPRNQSGSFIDGIAEREQLLEEKMGRVQAWRAALKEAASISGFHSLVEGSEVTLVEEIVRDILKKLNRMSPVIPPPGLVGIHSRIKDIESLLHLDIPYVLTVGIWGMGGIGKTTIAKAVYGHIHSLFEASCFIEQARKELAEQLRDKIVSRLLDEEIRYVGDQSLEPAFIKDRLHRKRVLIVLDDVDNLLQLQKLQELFGGHFGLLGPWSRILATSRDSRILKNMKANSIYEVMGLNNDEALELFSLNAFRLKYPSRHVELSKKVVTYADSNPLALKVLGSTLFGRSEEDWASLLEDLKGVVGIEEVLRTSYDGLEEIEKEIFLDIVCFFGSGNRHLIEQILHGFYPSVHFRISNLIDKSLLTISGNVLEVHDLLREMGQNIVRAESMKDPGKRSRLWNNEDIHYVLTNKEGTEAVETIFLNLNEAKEMHLESDAFARMRRLRLVKFWMPNDSGEDKNKLHLPPDGLQSVSDQLRYFQWDGFPSKSLPLNFCAANLVELILRGSNIEQLWSGEQNIVNLRLIDLRFSQHLTTLPDLSRAHNLTLIELDGCTRLQSLPDLSKAQNLTDIYLLGCTSLEKLPVSIQYLSKLEILDLTDCRNLQVLPHRLDSPFLRVFYLKGCSEVKMCPQVSGCLESLNLENSGIEEIPVQLINKLKDPKELDLSYCANLAKFPEITRDLCSLQILILRGTAIKEIPSSIDFLTRLECLKIVGCNELLRISTSICKLKSLGRLELAGCSKLEGFPEILEPMESLIELNLSGCESIKRFPDCFHNLKVLKHLLLSGTAIEELPSSIQHLDCLEELVINGCRNLFCVPSSFSKLTNLKILEASEIQDLQFLPQLELHKLKVLFLSRCNIMEIPTVFFSSLDSLKGLVLDGNNLESLPPSIKQLSRLEWLKLDDCKRLSCLPQLPESLCYLSAGGTKLHSFPENFNTLSRLSTLLLASCKDLGHILDQLPWSVETSSIWFDEIAEKHAVEAHEDLPETLLGSGQSHSKKLKLIDWFKLDQQTRREIMPLPTEFLGHPIYCKDQRKVVFPGSEVPEWFSDQSEGNFVNVQLPSNSHQYRGIVFCVVLEWDHTSGWEKLIENFFIDCLCFLSHGNIAPQSWCPSWVCDLQSIGSDHVFIWYDFSISKWSKWLAAINNEKAVFKFYPPRPYKVKKCGVLIL